MQLSIKRHCLLAISIATAAAFGQDPPQANSGPLKRDDVHATLVTLHAHKAATKDVLDQLNQQSGMRVTLIGVINDTVTVDAPRKAVLGSALQRLRSKPRWRSAQPELRPIPGNPADSRRVWSRWPRGRTRPSGCWSDCRSWPAAAM